MDHYERLEQIDYKSARDVVTEADHLSEALILDAIRARYPADAILAEETGEHQREGGRGAHLGAWPGLDRRPARRHGQLRQRPARLLRLDRAGRRWAARGRGHPRPDPERDVRRDRRLARRPSTGARSVPRRRRSCPTSSSRWRSTAGPPTTRAAQRPQGDPDLARHGLGRARPGVRRERPVRRVHPAGRAVGLGRRRGRADRRAGRRPR